MCSCSVVAVVSAGQLYELCDRPIFIAQFADAVFEMVHAVDGTEDQPGAEHNQAEIEEHQRQQRYGTLSML